jgi:hypothetical protein
LFIVEEVVVADATLHLVGVLEVLPAAMIVEALGGAGVGMR